MDIDLSQLSDREQRLAVFLLNRTKFTVRDGACNVKLNVGRDEVAEFAGVLPRSIYPRIERLGRKLKLRFGRWSNRGRPAHATSQQQRPAA